jgi:predicted transcriptional regulator
MTPLDLHTLARAALVPVRSEARALFDAGLTVGQVAADLGVTRSTAEYLTRTPAPRWPVLSEELISRLPAHLQALARKNSL